MYHYHKSFRYLLKKKATQLKTRVVQMMPHFRHKHTMQRVYGDKKIKPLPLSGVKFQYKKLPIPELNNSRR